MGFSGRAPNPILEHPVEAALAGLLLLALLFGSSSDPSRPASTIRHAAASPAEDLSLAMSGKNS